jgi:hypothetical protein
MNDLKSLITKDEVVSGARYRNRKFLLDLFEHIINNKKEVVSRAEQILLDNSTLVPKGVTINEDVAMRAEVIATISDLMTGCEGIMQACLKQGGFNRVYVALKQGQLDLDAEAIKHGLSPI